MLLTVSPVTHLRKLAGDDWRLGNVVGERGLRWPHGADARELRGALGGSDGRVQDGHGQHNLGGKGTERLKKNEAT